MASTRRKQREQLPGWAWMLFGLSIGLSFALFVYLQSNELVISDSLRELTSEIRFISSLSVSGPMMTR